MRPQLLSTAPFAVTFLLLAMPTAHSQELYREAFDDGGAANNWGMNASSSDTSAIFGYDYGTNESVPEAPHKRAGDTATSGVILEANIDAPAALEVFTLYPLGQNFTGNYQLRFDAWMNYDVDEVLNGSASGTTEFLGGGLGYDGTKVDVGSGVQALTTGDGGSSADWRVFKDRTAPGVDTAFYVDPADMAAGSRNNAEPYYADFLPGVSPPAGQDQTVFDPGRAGSAGFQWLTWEFRAVNSIVDITIEKPDGSRLLIATVDTADTSDGSIGFTTDGNISLVYADFFSSVSPRGDLTFGVIDNVEVAQVSAIYGDFNNDGTVDLGDYNEWRDHLGAPNGTLANDPYLTDIGMDQYTVWKQNFGRSLVNIVVGSVAIPEPSTALLAAGGLLVALVRRWSA